MSATGMQLLSDPAPTRSLLPHVGRTDHPLDGPLRQVTALGGKVRAGLGLAGRPLEAWTLATELADPASEQLERSLRRTGVAVRSADRLVMMSLFFGSYVWQVAAAALGCSILTRRIPDVGAENVAVHVGDDGRVDEVRFLGGGFAALPDDPAADHQDAVIVRDAAAFREAFVRQLTDGHIEELIGTLQAQRGLSSRALWAAVEDRTVGALLWLGKRLGEPFDLVREAIVLSRTPPFVGTSGVLIRELNGQHDLALKRGFCCLSYKLEGKSPCQTCPLRCRPLRD